jgi:hypothetical protein
VLVDKKGSRKLSDVSKVPFKDMASKVVSSVISQWQRSEEMVSASTWSNVSKALPQPASTNPYSAGELALTAQ